MATNALDFTLRSIGVIHSPFTDKKQTPIQPSRSSTNLLHGPTRSAPPSAKIRALTFFLPVIGIGHALFAKKLLRTFAIGAPAGAVQGDDFRG